VKVIYLKPYYLAEVNVARAVKRLTESTPRLFQAQKELPGLDYLSLFGTQLSEEQRQAIKTALTSPISILTGGPGTGKTFTIKTLVDIITKARKRAALAAPTGRAAKRLTEASGFPASTIHRLLGYSPKGGFQHNQENPLPIDLLVIDEVSMMDVLLANALFKAIAPGTHLLLVGDVDQLPSVGAGDVLRDLIDSQLIPLTRLNQVFRQSAHSHIIRNAHFINQGKLPVFDPESQDFFFFPGVNPEEAGKWVEEIVCERIPRRFNIKPEATQVLSPMYRGAAGVDALNQRLQARLNPPSPGKPEKALYGQVFRLHDRVMQTQNNYDKNTFNGDIGRVTHLSLEDQTLVVDFDGNQVEYMWHEVDQLVLAYAISVHKSQGSEFNAVVITLLTQHYMMLQRNLLYTAITRARNLCVLVGDRKAVAIAVRNNKVSQRFSALDYRLRHLQC
jgi:exodeoxyribonuclease V alpha subunit